MQALQVPAVHVVGHSSGGHVAALFAAARPELVRSVTLLNAPYNMTGFELPFPFSLFGSAAARDAAFLAYTAPLLSSINSLLLRPYVSDAMTADNFRAHVFLLGYKNGMRARNF